MEKAEKKSRTVKISIIISIILSIVTILIILKFTINQSTLEYLSQVHIRYEYFLIAILLNVISWVLWGLRLQVLSNSIDKKLHIGLWKSTKIVIAPLSAKSQQEKIIIFTGSFFY